MHQSVRLYPVNTQILFDNFQSVHGFDTKDLDSASPEGAIILKQNRKEAEAAAVCSFERRCAKSRMPIAPPGGLQSSYTTFPKAISPLGPRLSRLIVPTLAETL